MGLSNLGARFSAWLGIDPDADYIVDEPTAPSAADIDPVVAALTALVEGARPATPGPRATADVS